METNDQKQNNERELQPDPLMKVGRSSKAWFWIVCIIILAAIIITFVGVDRNDGTQRTAQQSGNSHYTTGTANKSQPATVPSGNAPSTK